jgi:plastocyanin
MNARRVSASAAVLLVALAMLAGCGSKTATPTTPKAKTPQTTGKSVSIKNISFEPSTITVKVGDTVTWTNNDNVDHTVTGSGMDSGTMKPGDTYKHQFNTVGTFNYQCTVHPAMLGQVVATQ